MSTVLLYVLGIVIFAVGLLISIAWHELGHLTFAKLFGVRVTQYMIGFGKTIWSRRRGETEYGIKAVPLGGYIRMVGMVPPGKDGRQRITSTGFGPTSLVRQLIEDARAGDRAEVTPADDGRQFYQLHPAKRIVIMLAGPLQNLIFAVILFGVLMMVIGVPTPSTTLAEVDACVIPVSSSGQAEQTQCQPSDPKTPAAAAGLRPGDTITSFDGTTITSWAQLTPLIAAAGGQTVTLGYSRAGVAHTATVRIISTERPVYDSQSQLVGATVIGFLGVGADEPYVTTGVGGAFTRTGQFIGAAADALVRVPQRIPGLWDAIVHPHSQRNINSPMGIIGAGRIGGQILSSDDSTTDKVALLLSLLAGFNMSLFLLNLLPLLPLDGGHVLGAAIEWIRRGWAQLRRRARPAPFDVATLMPVAYVVALLFIGLTVLTGVADIVNPVPL